MNLYRGTTFGDKTPKYIAYLVAALVISVCWRSCDWGKLLSHRQPTPVTLDLGSRGTPNAPVVVMSLDESVRLARAQLQPAQPTTVINHNYYGGVGPQTGNETLPKELPGDPSPPASATAPPAENRRCNLIVAISSDAESLPSKMSYVKKADGVYEVLAMPALDKGLSAETDSRAYIMKNDDCAQYEGNFFVLLDWAETGADKVTFLSLPQKGEKTEVLCLEKIESVPITPPKVRYQVGHGQRGEDGLCK